MRLEIFVTIMAAALVVIVVELVRRRRLTESFAVLWIGVGLATVALSIARPLFDRFSRAIGVSYGTSLLFAAAILFLLLVCMSLSVHVSSLRSRLEVLAEEVAFLRGVHAPDEKVDDKGAHRVLDD